MAAPLPAKLKELDCQRFAVRAAQLEKFRPVVSYWCYYWILETVLRKKLHQSDEECSAYAITLMDKLESTKAEQSSEPAVVDDAAAKAYCTEFAQETLKRADDEQRKNVVTKQTADTFMAAATFLDLTGIWGEGMQAGPEEKAKGKFAKYHAARILKALKAGEDPNKTNPVVEEETEESAEGDIEAELRNMEGAQNEGSGYQPPTVETVPNSGMPSRPASTAQTLPTAPPPAMSPPEEATARQSSVGGGYFPSVPSASSEDVDMSNAGQPSVAQPPSQMNAQDFYNTTAASPPVRVSTPGSLGMSDPGRPNRPPPPGATDAHVPISPPVAAAPVSVPGPAPFPPPAHVPAAGPPPGGYRTDDDSTMQATKHAKWAISALNFEDVNTAVNELRAALQSLGAT